MSLDQMFDNANLKMDIDRLKDLLRSGICNVVFTKKDGTERMMRCTLNESYVVPHEKTTDREKTPNLNVVSVWDLDVNGWRSFRYDSIKEVHY